MRAKMAKKFLGNFTKPLDFFFECVKIYVVLKTTFNDFGKILQKAAEKGEVLWQKRIRKFIFLCLRRRIC